MLLGNMGRPGGGILALRGHANIQGATDIPTLFHLLGGYMPMPGADEDMASYLSRMPDTGFWGNKRAFLVSMLKAWFGDAATAENDYCFGYLPRITGDHGTYRTMLDMIDGKVKGYFLLGENPAVGSAGGRLQRLALANLDWLVVKDLAHDRERVVLAGRAGDRDAASWSPSGSAPRCSSCPRPSHVEKDGTFTNTQRLLQWHDKALEPPGDARSDLWFMYDLGKRIRAKLAGVRRPRRPAGAGPDLGLPGGGRARRAVGSGGAGGAQRLRRRTARRSTTFAAAGRRWLDPLRQLDPRGLLRRRSRTRPRGAGRGSEQSWVAPEWGWAWPANRRILYNRASADPAGQAVERGQGLRLVGRDRRASGPATTCRTSRRPSAPDYRARAGGDRAGRARRRPIRSSCSRTARRRCSCRGPAGRPAAGAFRSGRVAGAQPRLQAGRQPGGDPVPGPAADPRPAGRSRRHVPLRRDHLPAHRASHRGRA